VAGELGDVAHHSLECGVVHVLPWRIRRSDVERLVDLRTGGCGPS
jgi:hypothetical protein